MLFHYSTNIFHQGNQMIASVLFTYFVVNSSRPQQSSSHRAGPGRD